MGDLVNLRRARKAKERSLADKKADENRRRFGLTLAERNLTKAETRLERTRFEGHRLSQTAGTETSSGAVSGDVE